MKNACKGTARMFLVATSILLLLSVSPVLSMIPSEDQTTAPLNPYHYHTYQEMADELHALQVNHSDIMAFTSLGKTYQGRDIWMVKLSDNVTAEEQEPGVLFMGAHHGNEKPSYEILIFFIQYMVENYDNESNPEVRDALDYTQIFVIPMVNPDGVEADTRKNCAPNYGPFGFSRTITSYGVNLNRNYNDYWFLSYIFPVQYGLPFILPDSSQNYRGPRPFSENETRAVKNFAETHDFSISISYHSYGQVIFYPWMHTTRLTSDEALFISVGENMSRIDKYDLFVGNRYLIPRYGGTLGTSENWLYRERGVLAYTVELCSQRAPTDPRLVQNVCMIQTKVHLYLCQRVQTLTSERELSSRQH